MSGPVCVHSSHVLTFIDHSIISATLYRRDWIHIELYCAPCNFQANSVQKLTSHARTNEHLERTDIEGDDVVRCKTCDSYIPAYSWDYHLAAKYLDTSQDKQLCTAAPSYGTAARSIKHDCHLHTCTCYDSFGAAVSYEHVEDTCDTDCCISNVHKY